MKIFLDDEREAPPGWERVYWPDEAIELIKTGNVEEVSLDHDLGDDEKGTGYDVIKWIELSVALGELDNVPDIKVHSANISARKKMELGIESIKRLADKNKELNN